MSAAATQVFKDLSGNECAVCLQTIIHPAVLPCGHVFCFLCVKGIAFQNKCCAMCRQEIPMSYFDKPCLLNLPNSSKSVEPVFEDGFQWFYEGKNGWWQYDERTSVELESSFQKGERMCQLLIAGFIYIADFEAMIQVRQNDASRRRKIKRDLATIQKKGVAGLRGVEATAEARTVDLNSSEESSSTEAESTESESTESLETTPAVAGSTATADAPVEASDSTLERSHEAEGCDSPENSESAPVSSPEDDTVDSILVRFRSFRLRSESSEDSW